MYHIISFSKQSERYFREKELSSLRNQRVNTMKSRNDCIVIARFSP